MPCGRLRNERKRSKAGENGRTERCGEGPERRPGARLDPSPLPSRLPSLTLQSAQSPARSAEV